MIKKHRGFTLIELLIVVAIIAILAAIAVPNFMEAQVRAKVARCSSDLRSIATAMESYRIDHGRYTSYGAMGRGGGVIFPELQPDGLPPATQGTPLTYDLLQRTEPGSREEWFYTWSSSFYTAHAPGAQADSVFPNLTTPISYITSFPADPFGFMPGGPFSYFHTHNHTAWIVFSTGPRQSLGLLSSVHQTYRIHEGLAAFDESHPRYPYLILNPYGGNPTQQLVTGRSIQPDDEFHGAHTYDPTNGTRSTGNIWRVGP